MSMYQINIQLRPPLLIARNSTAKLWMIKMRVEKTYDELKKRYEAALSGKSRQENIVSMIRAEIATSYQEVFIMIRQAQQILEDW